MSSFNTPWFNSQDPSFFNTLNKSQTVHVVLAAETDDFAPATTQQWVDEGCDVRYVALGAGGREFVDRVHAAGDASGVGESYAVVAYGDAASLLLLTHTKPTSPRLVALIAYYPTTIPSPQTKFPVSMQVLVHLAGPHINVQRTPQVLGIQGKPKTVQKRLVAGAGLGGGLDLGFPAYMYAREEGADSEAIEPGFAEHDLDEYAPTAAALAFARSVEVVRRGFRCEAERRRELERIREEHIQDTLFTGEAGRAAQRFHSDGHVLLAPTLTGGMGDEEIGEFYAEFFRPLTTSTTTSSDPNNNATIDLLSRTIGSDRIVDEISITLVHDREIPWLLPDTRATHRRISFTLVAILHVRGRRIESEHVYWDQASVLFQAGLLQGRKLAVAAGEEDDEDLSSERARKERNGNGNGTQGIKGKTTRGLPVVGAEAARAVKRGGSRVLNALMPGW